MTKAADVSTKRLISLAPDNWVKWVTQNPDVVAKEILNSEFQWISRESDVLIRVESPQEGEFLVINELQLRYQTEMPRRVRAYAALAEEKFNLPVYPVLINLIKSTNAEIPTSYSSNVGGLRALQEYRVINLWEVDVNIVFTQPLPSLLPFVPILKGGDNESTIREALRILRTDENLNQLETVLGFFATFVLDSALVQQIMRWDMVILEQSPWYQEIFKKGEVRGEERARREELLSSIELLLEVKFGNDGLNLIPLISSITDAQRLKEIQLAIKNNQTVNELQQFLSSDN